MKTKIKRKKENVLVRFIAEQKLGFASLLIITLMIFIAIFASKVAPYDPIATDFENNMSRPSLEHLLGTDELSRDIFSRIIFATRTSLIMGFAPTTINMIIGTIVGVLSGLSGKIVDAIIMRIVDIILSFPFIILAMAIVYNFGPSLFNLFLALVLVGWAGIARVVRAETIALKENTYIEAAKSMGVSKFTIMYRHILPNIISTLIVLYTMKVPQAILAEAGLSFLGFGAQPPATSLGVMVSKGRTYLFDAPWISIAPGVFILIIAMSFNFLGDSLRDMLDSSTRDVR
ncbi:MAG: ABC transporter permease [Maledivibacter sp.]|nr:ABC transporter permease [Maledivibacter sp.]